MIVRCAKLLMKHGKKYLSMVLKRISTNLIQPQKTFFLLILPIPYLNNYFFKTTTFNDS